MNQKSNRPAEERRSQEPPKPQDAAKSADPKQVGQTGNIQQNTSNRRHQQQREER